MKGSILYRLLILFAAIAAVFAFSATPALAANSTCTTHNLAVTGWSIQTDQATTSWDFKCGGANNEPYTIELDFQWEDAQSNWHTFDCDNGLPCLTNRPGAFTYYNGGTEHSGTNTWNVAGQLNCADIRFHALVQFEFGSPSQKWNSITYHVGC